MKLKIGKKIWNFNFYRSTSKKKLKQKFKFPTIVREIARADKGLKTFLVNCHPYVVAGATVVNKSPNMNMFHNRS